MHFKIKGPFLAVAADTVCSEGHAVELTFSASVQRGITSYFRLVISSLSTIIFISVQNQKLGLCNLILAVNILGVHITCIVFHSRLLPASAKDFRSSPKKKILIKTPLIAVQCL